MKKISLLLIVGLSIFVTSCALLSGNGAATKAEAKGRAKIVNVESQINANTAQKLDTIAGLAFGTDYALSKVTNAPREVIIARDINKRVESIAGSPTLAVMKDMQDTIDKLVSKIQIDQLEGAKKLALKDSEITTIQNTSKELIETKENEIRNYMITAQAVASTADAYKVQLADYQGWFGLKAVFKGLYQFIKTSMWILIGGSIIFLILRLLAASNPIAAAIFSIVDVGLSWIVNAIRVLAPKALEVAGTVESNVYSATKNTLTKIVDCVETSKLQANSAGKEATLQELLDNAELSMTAEDKALVNKIKVQLGWSKTSVKSVVSNSGLTTSTPPTSSVSPISGSNS